MQNTPPEVIIANITFIVFWVLIVALVWLIGKRYERTRAFRGRMIAQWRPALTITLVYWLGSALSGRGLVNLSLPAIFCQALIGLALARGIVGYEPLKTTQAILHRERVVRNVGLFITIGILAGIVALFIGSVGMSIAQSIFHEINRTQETAQSFSMDKAQAFFLFLSGAGIGEETPYRLVALSFLWAMTGRRWFAIVVSAILFGAYHLSPLNGMYLRWWQFPVSQFLASLFIGILWGYVFTKRDYETVVLSHTLTDWITVLLFA